MQAVGANSPGHDDYKNTLPIFSSTGSLVRVGSEQNQSRFLASTPTSRPIINDHSTIDDSFIH